MSQELIIPQDRGFTALTETQLKALPTKRLLAFYKKHRHLRGFGICGCCAEILDIDNVPKNKILNDYLDYIKNLLDFRNHVQ